MELSLITPPAFVEYTELLPGRFCIGSVAQSNQKYRDFFKDSARKGYRVILDNGAFEGYLLDNTTLHELALEIGASVVIAPDIYGGNIQESTKLSLSFVEQFPNTVYEKMLVLQCARGQTITTVDIANLPLSFAWVGIPRVLTHNMYAGKTHCTSQEMLRFLFSCSLQCGSYCSSLFKKLRERKIHFLGLGDELFMLPYFWWVDSMDTAALFWQAWCGNTVTSDGFLHTRISRPHNYFALDAKPSSLFEANLRHNCKRALEWAEKANEKRREITGDLYS